MSQKAKAVNKSRDHDKYSEAAEEISVPKLILAPTSNHHKWKKQILKKLKKDFGPIHEAVVSKCYPNFQEESMQIICTPPEKIFKELSKISRLPQPRQRKSIATRGRISIFSAKFEDESTDASDANYSSSDESSAYVTARSKKVSILDPLSKSSPSVESMLKMSAADDEDDESQD